MSYTECVRIAHIAALLLIFSAMLLLMPHTLRTGYDNKLMPALQNLYSIAQRHRVIGMSVLGYRENGVQFMFNYGYSDIKRRIKVDENTFFLVASISKLVTGLALMKLVESGAIRSIDDDIDSYLGYRIRNPNFPDIPITIRHLMTHTSGITDNGFSYTFINDSYSSSPPPLSELLAPGGRYYVPTVWAKTPPGAGFNYSNLGATIIAAIVGVISHKRFDVYVHDTILKPLSMKSSFDIETIPDMNKIAVIYQYSQDNLPYETLENYNGVRPPPIDLSGYTPGMNPTQFLPWGGFRARVRGLQRLMDLFINGGYYKSGTEKIRVFDKSTIAAMLKTRWTGNALNGMFNESGLFINITESLVPGQRMYGHMGDAFGLLSAMYFNPDRKFGIIFVSNGSDHEIGESGFYALEEEIFRQTYEILFQKK